MEVGDRTRARIGRLTAAMQVFSGEEWWRSYGPPLVYGARCESRGAGSIPARVW